MNRYSSAGLLTTNPSEMGAFLDNGNYHRVIEWAERPEEVKMSKPENDNALLEFIQSAPVTMNTDYNNPVIRFRRDGALATYTYLTAAMSAGDTSVTVEDGSIFSAGHVAQVVSTGQELYISAVSGNTLTIDPDLLGPQFAAELGAEIRPANPMIGERGRLKEAYSTYPGDPSYNYITFSGLRFGMSTAQRNAAMKGEWGTWDKLSMDTKYQVETMLQNAVISQNRYTANYTNESSVDEKQVFRGAGLTQQLSGNVLDLGTKGTNFLWEHINDFINPMFVSDLSAAEKQVFAGHNMWADALSTARQMGAMESDEITLDPQIGARQFVMYTTEGKRVVWNHVNGMDGERANLAIVLDAANIGGGQYAGLGPQWFFGLQDNDDVLGEDAGYFTSWECHIYDRSTCGIIRGGTQSIVQHP